MTNPVEALGQWVWSIGRYGRAAMVGAIIGAAFVLGFMVGQGSAECGIVERNRAAFMEAPEYWTGAMRTVVESCDRGEGM